MTDKQRSIAILGAGNIGCAIADGLESRSVFPVSAITMTRRRPEKLQSFSDKGFSVTENNTEAVLKSDIVLISVEPHQADGLLNEIAETVNPEKQMVISVVSGATISDLKNHLPDGTPIARAMPNTAIAIGESMTCICADEGDDEVINATREIFSTVGETRLIREEQMTSATALCACGIAFFLRAIRAASQGGIEIGFDADDSLAMAVQTAKGAASLLSTMKNHPEFEIDRVTTPRGCTISGLNQMEHGGFSSAMIRGILTSAEKAEKLY